MTVAHWILLGGFVSYLGFAIYHLNRFIRNSGLTAPSQGKGNAAAGFGYSFTGGMSPVKKETAYLHLPTYAAGIIYHLSAFFAFAWLIIHLIGWELPHIIKLFSAIWLLLGLLNGLFILFKRIVTRRIRMLSTPDDYASNILITGFQTLSAAAILYPGFISALFIYTGLMFLYMQIGKLRHILYFFLARLSLGHFFGFRGVWPPKRRHEWQQRTP